MFANIFDVRDAVRRGEARAAETIEHALSQLEAVNPRLDSVKEILHESARTAAQRVDARIAAGEELPLAGVAFTAKDNICTPCGHTTAGSRILERFAAPYSATVIERLEAAGAVCVGKTNLDEFGMGSSTENSAFATTKNPWSDRHVPGGSSGGAAATAAATCGMIHLGSDTGGSIRQPAGYCGVAGFKPSYGRVSRFGLLAFASSLDQIGCLQTSAAECAAVLDVIGGHDRRDSTSSREPMPSGLDSISPLVKGVKLGVPREYFPEGLDPDVRAAVERAIDTLRELGAEVREVDMPHTVYANPVYVLISAAEASSNLARYDGIHYGHRAKDADGLIDLYSRTRDEGFGPEVKRRVMIGTFVLSSGYHDAFYKKACQVRKLVRRDFETVFEEVDALVSPTSPVTAFGIGERFDDPLKLYAVDVLTVPANLAGIPGLSVPCGFSEAGLPIGLQLYGRAFADGDVLRLGHAYQEATDFHLRRPSIHAAGD